MTPLDKPQKEGIIKRISFISQEVRDLQRYRELQYKDYSENRDIQRQVERSIEVILNAVIDITKIVLSGENLKVPSTYRECIQQIGAVGFIENDTASELEKYVELRNILAHEYLDIRWAKIKKFIDNSNELMDKFISSINKKI